MAGLRNDDLALRHQPAVVVVRQLIEGLQGRRQEDEDHPPGQSHDQVDALHGDSRVPRPRRPVRGRPAGRPPGAEPRPPPHERREREADQERGDPERRLGEHGAGPDAGHAHAESAGQTLGARDGRRRRGGVSRGHREEAAVHLVPRQPRGDGRLARPVLAADHDEDGAVRGDDDRGLQRDLGVGVVAHGPRREVERADAGAVTVEDLDAVVGRVRRFSPRRQQYADAGQAEGPVERELLHERLLRCDRRGRVGAGSRVHDQVGGDLQPERDGHTDRDQGRAGAGPQHGPACPGCRELGHGPQSSPSAERMRARWWNQA